MNYNIFQNNYYIHIRTWLYPIKVPLTMPAVVSPKLETAVRVRSLAIPDSGRLVYCVLWSNKVINIYKLALIYIHAVFSN